MTVYRALDIIPSQTKLPEKPPTASIALHLIIENFNERGRGRKPARERIEAMLERDYAMVKNGNCDYKLTVAYDPDPDGISLDEEIQSLLSEMFNIAESRTEEHKSELQSLMHIPYDVICLKKKK